VPPSGCSTVNLSGECPLVSQLASSSMWYIRVSCVFEYSCASLSEYIRICELCSVDEAASTVQRATSTIRGLQRRTCGTHPNISQQSSSIDMPSGAAPVDGVLDPDKYRCFA